MEDIAKLENASSLIMSPPNKVTASQRTEAEMVFMQLKRLQRPYTFCQLILDSSSSDYVKFQALSTMKEALSREWPSLAHEEQLGLRQQTLQYLMTKHNTIPKYVREQVIVLLVLIIKRGVVDQGGQQVLNMFIDQMSHLLMEPSQIEIGCSVLNTLLVEISNANGSSAIGMPLEFHLRAKKILENNGGLLKIFNISVQLLQHYINKQKVLSSDQVSQLVSLCLVVLSWDFRSSYMYHLSSQTSSSVPFKPTQDFSTILLNPSLIQLFMTIFSRSFTSNDLSLIVGQCLSQLASLTGSVFSCTQEKVLYVGHYLEGLILSVKDSADVISIGVVYQISQSCRHLVTSFSRECFISLSKEVISPFIEMVTHFVQFVCQRTAHPREVSDESDLAMCEESLCLLLEVIVRLIEGPKDALYQSLTGPAANLFMVYLRSKLTQPLGNKTFEHIREVNVDLEEDDRTMYEDELSYIGAIARAVLPLSLPHCLSALQKCISECSSILLSFTSDQNLIPDSIDYLEYQYENIHWLLMVSTYTVADIVTSEDSIIPVEITDYSHSMETTPMGVPFQDIVLSDDLISDTGFVLRMDPLVSLVACICRWCLVEKTACENGLKDVVSPQTSETAVWALTYILSPYLMMDEKNYDELSIAFIDVFGSSSDNSKWIMSFIIDKILFNLSVWYTEESLMTCTLKMLSKLAAHNKRRALYLISTDQLWYLMNMYANGHHPFNVLSSSVQKEVVGGLLACATGVRKDRYLNELLTPLSARFNSIVLMDDFTTRCHDDIIRLPLISVLEALSSIALCTRTAMVNDLFTFLHPILRSCVQLFYLFVGYQDMIVTILRLFYNVAETFTIFLNDSDARNLYEVSLILIEAYSKHHTGKYSKGVLGEEEECEDLVMFIQILSNLTTKDYLDFGSKDDQQPSIKPVEVVMKGLVIVLPIINDELLKYPDLCKHFYELLHYVCEIFPEGIAMLSTESFHRISSLIDVGCTRYGSDVCKSCVEDIESIASCTECGQLPSAVLLYQHFLKNLLEHIISVDFDTNMLNIYAGALYQLICALKDHQEQLMEAILSACISEGDRAHLQSAIRQLLTTVVLDGTRASKDKFKKNLKEFLPTLRGYLCVK